MVIQQQYFEPIEAEVLRDRITRKFYNISLLGNLRIAGQLSVCAQINVTENTCMFDVTFWIYLDVKLSNISTKEIERTKISIIETEMERILNILRKQRVHYHTRSEIGKHSEGGVANSAVKEGDCATVNLVGKIDSVVFQSGNNKNFAFVLGETRMLPKFEKATPSLRAGESREFDLKFPNEYPSKGVAGKTAQFSMTMKKVTWLLHLLEIDTEFVKLLGVLLIETSTRCTPISTST